MKLTDPKCEEFIEWEEARPFKSRIKSILTKIDNLIIETERNKLPPVNSKLDELHFRCHLLVEHLAVQNISVQSYFLMIYSEQDRKCILGGKQLDDYYDYVETYETKPKTDREAAVRRFKERATLLKKGVLEILEHVNDPVYLLKNWR